MMKNISVFYAVLVLMSSLVIAPVSALAEDQIVFSGKVITQQGQRLKIELQDGSTIWVSIEQSLPENAVGQNISGKYVTEGDTYFLIDPTFNN